MNRVSTALLTSLLIALAPGTATAAVALSPSTSSDFCHGPICDLICEAVTTSGDECPLLASRASGGDAAGLPGPTCTTEPCRSACQVYGRFFASICPLTLLPEGALATRIALA